MKKLFLRLALLTLGLTSTAWAQNSVTMWQADAQHTGQNLKETILTPGTVASPGNFGLLFTQPTDGQMYGQPLVAAGVSIGGTTHNVVYVTTEHDSLYAFDADSNTGSNASPLWQASFIQSGVTQPVPQANVNSSDISDEIGITTTPVIDLSTSTIYVVSKIQKISDGTYHQYLHALNLATGAEKFNGPVEINPTFPGSSNYVGTEQTTPGVVPFNALREHLRSAMALNNGVVYLAYASHSDTNPYHGEILGYSASTLQLVKSFISTPNGTEGGFWGAGASPAFDTSGNMFIPVANGAFDQTASGYTPGTDWGESMLKMSTTGTLSVSYSNTLNWFTPNIWNNLNNGDLDVGSSGLLLLPDQTGGSHTHLLIGGGKGGVMYVVDRDNMGGLNTPDSAVQEFTTPNSNYLFVTPAYFNGNIYYASSGGPLEQHTVGYNATTETYVSTTGAKSSQIFNGKGSGCFISANGSTNGIVWILTGSGLQAYDATNVALAPLITINSTTEEDVSCQNTKFSLPTVVNGKAYFTGYVENGSGTNRSTGHLFVCGIFPSAAGTPAAPSNAAATAASATSTTVTWTDNSDNETSFIVERATSASGPFTATGSPVGANVTTFTDTGLSPNTTYYYQVFADNTNGASSASNVATVTTFPVYSANGLVAYWALDESASSGTASDSSGNGHTGTVNGEAVFAPGLINNGIELHGTGNATSNISVPNTASMQFSATQSFTLSAWVMPENIHGAEQAMLAKSADQGNEYGIWINSSNKYVFRGPGGDLAGPVAATDVWAHVAVVQDGTAGTRKIYVNGVLQASGAAQAADGAGALWMGQQNNSSALDSFPGVIDEVRLYNRALAATEITTLMGPPILEALSTQKQGNSGTYGLVIAPSLTQVCEPREGATAGTYNLVLNFSAPVSGITATLGLQNGNAAVGKVSSLSYDSTGKIVTVVLTGVANQQALNLHLSNIQPGGGTADLPFNILWGDVNSDNIVDYLDAAIVENNQAPLVSASTYLYDINCDGEVTSADTSLANSFIGTKVGTEVDTNMALYQPASDLDSLSPNYAPLAFDNLTSTRWESIHGIDPGWIVVDLGSISAIHSIVLNWENAAGANYYLQSSNDYVNWTNLLPEITGNTTGGIKTYTGLTGSGRFVRMYGLTRTTVYGYSLWEFQVNGIPGAVTANLAPSITGDLSTSGTQGQSLSYQITASNSPTSYAVTSLPAGLTLNSSTGLIAGSPSGSGTFTGYVTATNSHGTSIATPVIFTLASSGNKPVITSATAALGTVGAAFSFQIVATNSPTSYSASGLPAGLGINTTSGLISGTPTAAGGPITASLSATNSSGTGTGSLAITIASAVSHPVITSAATAAGTVGTAFSYQITATNSPTSYNATGLPAGLGINKTTGLISGTPTTAGGPTTVTLTAANASGTGTGTVAITIKSAAPAITSVATASGTVGTSFSYQITATNGPISYNATGLPAGLTINKTTGLISGTPTTAGGPTSVTITAANTSGTGTGTVGITIKPLTPVITSATATGTEGTAFSYQIKATNSPASYNASGLPAGLGINATTGLISGTPTAAGGPTVVTISATNAGGTGSGTVSITIKAAAPVITSATSAAGVVGTPFSYQITATNGPTSYNATGMPIGLTVNKTTGLISGTPTHTGVPVKVAVSATNATGTGKATVTMTISVASAGDTNVALSKTATASSFQPGNLVAYANDGNTGTRWAASSASFPQWWMVDLGASKTLSRVDIAWYSAATRNYQYHIDVSTNNVTFTTVVDKTTNQALGNTSDSFTATARYVRVTVTNADGGWASAYEIGVYGH